MASFSERFALKESRALLRVGDPAIYNAQGTGPDVPTHIIVEEDTELETEVGTETTTILILSNVLHPDHARNDELTINTITYRLNRKIKTEGSLISYTVLEV